MEALEDLIAAAASARRNAHAPYSRFPVGAAVRADDGSVYVGCNVENAASPEGLCAEAAAIAAMVTAGRRRIVAVAVVGGDGERPCMPCGGCRQKIREFAAADVPIAVADADGVPLRRTTLGALLPEPFGPEVR